MAKLNPDGTIDPEFPLGFPMRRERDTSTPIPVNAQIVEAGGETFKILGGLTWILVTAGVEPYWQSIKNK